jgi:adenylyltransferase/sulfurtransferase
MTHIDLTQSRYHRQELITWWDQSKLRAASVLVVGAGAIGNEVVKNLALVGVGQIEIVDMDTIEHSNLARCVFFREKHEDKPKAAVLASEVMMLNSDVVATAHVMPVQRLGVAYLRKFDVIIGALDNREARAWVNQAARKLGKYWIDGAIEGLRGLVRTFGPEGSCYACTLTEADYAQMAHRRSCALLAPEEMLSGKTPTNATTAGLVAGVQVQEAIKLIVGRVDLLALVGKCWQYIGDSMDTYVTRYREDEYCLAHDRYEALVDPGTISSMADLVAHAKTMTNEPAIAIDFEEDVIRLIGCPTCGGDEVVRVRSSFGLGAGRCTQCNGDLSGDMFTALEPEDPLVGAPINEFDFPKSEVVSVRTATTRVHFILEK